MKVFSASGFRAAAGLAAAGAFIFVFTASKCQNETIFPPYVAEICNDNIDNNGDGKIDCADPTCDGSAACTVSISIDVLPGIITTDSLKLSGHQTNATSIAVVSVTPAGTPAQATITGDTWTAELSNLNQNTLYTVTVVGSKGELKDTAQTTFTRAN